MREVRRFGTYRLDVQRRRLERADGDVVALGAKAFDVLVFLVDHAGEPMSRKALIDAVWPDTVVEENNLTQAISALRRALGDGYIATLPGRGYQFVAEVSRASDAAAERQSASPPEPANRPPAAAAAHQRLLGPAAAAALAVVLLAAAGYAWLAPNPGEGGSPQAAAATAGALPSIAVLPFVNVSDDAALDWFAEGLAIELRNRLDRIDGLRVPGQISSFAFKGQNADLRTIAEALKVETVLVGTVRLSGDRLRIAVELVDVDDGFTRWSSPPYDRESGDLLTIQDEIAHAVIRELIPTLGIDPAEWSDGGTHSVVAYRHFLRGIREAAQIELSAVANAADEFREAVRTDAHYGEAWVQLGLTLGTLAIYDTPRAEELLREREAVAEQARVVAPDLPLTQTLIGWIAYDERDWETSLSGCDKVFAATDPTAHQLCAGALTGLGFVKQAQRYREQAADADPLSVAAWVTLARHYALMGLAEDTETAYARSRAFPGGVNWMREEPLIYSLMNEGILPEQLALRLEPICAGLAELAERAEANGRLTDVQFCPVLLDALMNPSESSKELRGLLETVRSQRPPYSYLVVLFAAYLGETELALEALELFAETAPSSMYQHFWYPLLSDVRRTERFKDVMRRIGVAQWWRQSNRWNDYCSPVGREDFTCI